MLNKDFREFIELLRSNGVEFLVVGAHALAAHGRPRYTGDLDLWVRPESGNISRLVKALDDFGFASLGIVAQDFMQPQAMIQLGYPPARIDLLTAIDGVTFADAFEHRVDFDAGNGLRLPVISVDDLIRNKLATGRSKDLADVEALRGR
ncbi:DUF6036 family nucleotidyltransferase [Casimicrobium huifangae]|uniref:DUF6036 family nucleotidyltransferase n=1 Tax=Casimicrobium huifangae TaxID=2591109 RepID=UPI003782DC52